MKERNFDEMIAYFNRRVSEMDIAQDYKIELLGMVTALGYKHDKTAQQWIPCSERLPEYGKDVLCITKLGTMYVASYEEHIAPCSNEKGWITSDFIRHRPYVIAWMPLPEPYNPDDFSQHMNQPED